MTCSASLCNKPVFMVRDKLCVSCYRRQYRLANLDHHRRQDKANRERHKAAYMQLSNDYKRTDIGRYKGAIVEAKRRNLIFDLSIEDFIDNLRSPCEYCGEVEIIPNTGHRLDRIENSMGYTLNNIVASCGSCNKIRGDMLSYSEMLVAMRAVMDFKRSLITISDKNKEK